MRKVKLGWVLVLVLSACAPLSVCAGKAEDQIAAIEEARRKAIIEGDVAALEKIYSDDWFYNTASGESVSKAAYLERLRSGAVKVHSVTPEAVEIRVYNDAAVVTGIQHVKATVKGEDRDLHLRFLHVYVERDDTWSLVARQATNVPVSK